MKTPAAVICVSLWVYTALLHASHTGPKCGIPQVSPMDLHALRIVGGTEARRGSHPWLVSLRNRGSHFCGGAIVSDRWIMTAAHCFTSVSKEFLSRVSVAVAEFDQRVRDEEEQILLVKSVLIHEKYQHALPMSYDIALLELDERIRLGARVQPICLPLPNESTPHKTSCIVGGWGRLRERGCLPKVLREVQLDLMAPARCKFILQTVRTSFGNRGPAGQSRPAFTVLCAGPEKGGKDACQGDSGGPLVCPVRGNGRWVAVGVTSWGKGCGRSWGNNASRQPSKRGSPGLFSDVRLLLPWIKSKLRDGAGPCSVRDGPLTDTEGIIRNPALPGHRYDNNELCQWIIRAPPDHSILLEFTHFDLENDSSCLHDRVTVSIGSRRPVATFCGSVIPGPVLLNNIQIAALFFSSDITETRSGFAVRHRAILRATQAHSDAGCGTVVLVEDQNAIHSPNYPQSYSNNSVCRWVIYAPQGHIVKLDFEDFYLEESEGCLYDALTVLGDVDGTEEIAVLCGSVLPPPVLSYDTVMVVQFTTDSTITHRGFQATTTFISHADLHEQETVNWEREADSEPDKRTNEQTAHTDDLAANVRHATPHGPNGGGGGPAAGEGPQQRAPPWDMHLYLGKEFLCYGVLIQTPWVLITARCIIGLEENASSRLWVMTTGPDRQRRRVSRVFLHPHYQPFLWDYDAALLQLSSPLSLTERAQTICMQNKEEEQETLSIQRCTVSGWEEPTAAHSQIPMVVYASQVSVMSHSECERHYTSALPHDAMLCVRATVAHNQSQHHCMRSLGTSLVCQRADSNYVLMGLRRSEGQQVETGSSEWNERCGSFHFQTPAVFTSVAALRDWIQKHISADLDPSEPVDQLPGDSRSTSYRIVTDHQESSNPREHVDLSSEDEDYDTDSSGGGGCVNCWND